MTTKSALARYGLTPEDEAMLLHYQDGRCALCRRKFSARRVSAVDHDHRTGAARGLLCRPCNSKLGALHEDTAWLWRAAEYLEHPVALDVFDTPRYHVDAPPRRTL